MKTTLTAHGQINIPPEIQQADRLSVGDLFDLDRLTPGHYLLTKVKREGDSFTVATADDGLPVIQANGVITSRLVEEIEDQIA